MDKIRFTYDSAEANPIVILLLFFRFLGIYVFERLLDTPRVVLQEIQKMISDESDKKKTGESPETTELDQLLEFDAELFYISSFEDYQRIIQKKYFDTHLENVIVLYKEGSLPPGIVDSNEAFWISYSKHDSKQKLLYDLIDKMNGKKLLSENVVGHFKSLADVYTENRLWELSLTAKFFYVSDDVKGYTVNKDKYKKAIDQLFHVLQENGALWGDSKSLYLQFATLNLIYEFELYNQRNKQPNVFSGLEQVKLCESIIHHNSEYPICKEAFRLLQAQIYDDLLGDINMAYEKYLNCCTDYNAYAYFRKGIYWQNYTNNFGYALKYYYRSVQIYPEYYRAWYRIGNCYMQTKKYKKALKAFDIVCAILDHRLENKSIRPMEIEHMFKAKNQAAFICNKALQNPSLSITKNKGALQVWNAIESSSFYELMDDSGQETRTLKKIVADHLNVKKIWIELMKLGKTVRDNELVSYCEKMINHMEG